MPAARSENGAWFAMAGALILVSVHVAGKAVRDTLFLSNFAVTDLPTMMITGSVGSLLAAIVVSSLLSRANPARTVPTTVLLSALLLFGEWILVESSPRMGAVAVYLHLNSLSMVLFSGFWSVVNERFDPFTAKAVVARVSGAGALGGGIGGLMAMQIAPRLGVDALLPGFAVLHLVAAGLIFGLGRPIRGHRMPRSGQDPQPPEQKQEQDARGSASTYILQMGLLFAVIEGTEMLLDYAFKATAVETFPNEADLVQFFAVFYTALSVLAFVLQTSLGPRALKWIGVGGTMAILPLVVAATSAGAVFVQRLATVSLARGANNVIANSLFKASFELLWTPVPSDAKRRAKVFVDVGASGGGELVGSGILLALVTFTGGVPTWVPLLLATVLSLGSLWIVSRLHRGYIAQLAENLRRGVSTTAPAEPKNMASTLVESHVTIDRAELIARLHEIDRLREEEETNEPDVDSPQPIRAPRLADAVADLESAKPERVREALAQYRGRPELASHVIPLLGRPLLADEALPFLRELGPRITGQLIDVLIDPERDLLVRRRIPRVIEANPGPRALVGLRLGFEDTDFDVELECVRSALRVVQNAGLDITLAETLPVVERTLAVDERTWDQRGRRRGETRDESALLDLADLRRIDRNLELIFTALAAAFGREVMASAVHAIYFGDSELRGTALEYLQTILPERVHAKLFARLPGGATATTARHQAHELADTLLQSSTTISKSDLARAAKKDADDSKSS